MLGSTHLSNMSPPAGTGKTAIMRDKLKNMDSETMAFSTINMNSFSDAPSLQGTLEQPLEKKSGMVLHDHLMPVLCAQLVQWHLRQFLMTMCAELLALS